MKRSLLLLPHPARRACGDDEDAPADRAAHRLAGHACAGGRRYQRWRPLHHQPAGLVLSLGNATRRSRIENKTDLLAATWTLTLDNILPDGATTTRGGLTAASSQRFFRVQAFLPLAP